MKLGEVHDHELFLEVDPSWPLADGGTKTLSVEEMAVVTESSAELLIPRQEELILIPSRP